MGDAQVEGADELMIEFELCIKLIFKPFRHHVNRAVAVDGDILPLWKCILNVLEDLLRDRTSRSPDSSPNGKKLMSDELCRSMNELASEHLQNAIMFLVKNRQIVGPDATSPGDLTTITWESVSRMGVCQKYLGQWLETASNQTVNK